MYYTLLLISDIVKSIVFLICLGNIYAIVHGNCGKHCSAILSILYTWGFYHFGANCRTVFTLEFLGSLSLVCSILMVPSTLILFFRGKARIWGELVTIYYASWVVVRTRAFFLYPLISYFVWILIIDLTDHLFKTRITRSWVRRISEILGIALIGTGYNIDKFGGLFEETKSINTTWLYISGLMAFSIYFFF